MMGVQQKFLTWNSAGVEKLTKGLIARVPDAAVALQNYLKDIYRYVNMDVGPFFSSLISGSVGLMIVLSTSRQPE
jgi:hypothetical protein